MYGNMWQALCCNRSEMRWATHSKERSWRDRVERLELVIRLWGKPTETITFTTKVEELMEHKEKRNHTKPGPTAWASLIVTAVHTQYWGGERTRSDKKKKKRSEGTETITEISERRNGQVFSDRHTEEGNKEWTLERTRKKVSSYPQGGLLRCLSKNRTQFQDMIQNTDYRVFFSKGRLKVNSTRDYV